MWYVSYFHCMLCQKWRNKDVQSINISGDSCFLHNESLFWECNYKWWYLPWYLLTRWVIFKWQIQKYLLGNERAYEVNLYYIVRQNDDMSIMPWDLFQLWFSPCWLGAKPENGIAHCLRTLRNFQSLCGYLQWSDVIRCSKMQMWWTARCNIF